MSPRGVIRLRRGKGFACLVSLLIATASATAGATAENARSAEPRFAVDLLIHGDRPGATIDRNIYGQFVEHLGRGVEEGIWVGGRKDVPNVRGIRTDVVTALRKLSLPNIRWPGGCFADTYHWRDGVGPRATRQRGVNVAWGGADVNGFGTDEFMDFLGQIGGTSPFVSVNVGSGTIREADDWLKYMTAPADTTAGAERSANGRRAPYEVPFIGVGNESWGCGGNMTAETYAATFRQWAAYLRTYSGPKAKLIAVGADSDDYAWTETMMARAVRWRPDPSPLALTNDRPLMWGLSLHFYTFAGNDWRAKGRNVGFDESGWAKALARASLTDELIRRHSAVMDRYDPERKVALAVDEWGGWFVSEKDAPSSLYLESTLRDAVIAGLSLNIFNRHAERVRMANLAQMVNVIQSLVLTQGSKMVVTPTYHVFDLYRPHQDAALIPVDVATPDYVEGDVRMPAMSVSGSRDPQGRLHVSIVNLDPRRPALVSATLRGVDARAAVARTITADAIDTRVHFDAADPFVPRTLDGVMVRDGRLSLEVPARSVTMVELR